MFRVTAVGMTALLTLIGAAHPGFALERLQDGTSIRPDDVRRLEALDLSYGTALRQALTGGDYDTVQAVISALRGTPRAAQEVTLASLAGDWQCNMTKIGGISPGVAYPPFRCEIRQDGDQLTFEKLTGSQLTRGTLHHDGGRIVYLGTEYIRGSTPPAYADLPVEAPKNSGEQFFPDAGILEVVSDKQARIILPQPHLESEMNVLTLTR